MENIIGNKVPSMGEIKLKVIDLFSRSFTGIKVNG